MYFSPVPGSCKENPDTCHVFATCSDKSGSVNCTCKPGYEGDGFYCQMRDLCAVNNGNCGVNATCHFQGPVSTRFFLGWMRPPCWSWFLLSSMASSFWKRLQWTCFSLIFIHEIYFQAFFVCVCVCFFFKQNQRRCQCKQGFYRVNDRCQAFAPSSPCSANHGGCSGHASCTESSESLDSTFAIPMQDL